MQSKRQKYINQKEKQLYIWIEQILNKIDTKQHTQEELLNICLEDIKKHLKVTDKLIQIISEYIFDVYEYII